MSPKELEQAIEALLVRFTNASQKDVVDLIVVRRDYNAKSGVSYKIKVVAD